MDQQNKLLEVKNLKKYFPIKGGVFNREVGQVKAVDDVSFDIYKGETLGIVGESGSGKSTLGRTILRLLRPSEGQILFEGTDLAPLNNRGLDPFRKDMQMVFQDPFASLNPRMSIGELIEEPMAVQNILEKEQRKERVIDLLDKVGLPAEASKRFPHEFSGGQRQRIGIARSLTTNPKFIVGDEPVSALDVSVQSQVLNLLDDLQKEFNLTYLFISHDLSVVKHISDRVGVMYLGRIVEIGPKKEIYKNTLHPYTKALLQAIPIPNIDRKREKIKLTGDPPSPSNPPAGCAFHTRCPLAFDRCTAERPILTHQGNGHYVACHLFNEEKTDKK